MPSIPAEQLPRLQQWWSTVEPGTQAIFEAIYMDAPGAVSNALSGGAWVADSAEPGLAAQLGDVDESVVLNDQIPTLNADQVVTTPFHPGVGQAVTFTWTERNDSKAEVPAYLSDIYVTDLSGNAVGSARLPGAALAAGASIDRSWTLDTGVAAAGEYSIVVWMNSEGADYGSGVPGPQGCRTPTGASFEAGSSERSAGIQDNTAWFTGLGLIQQAASGMDFLENARTGVNWIASVENFDPTARTELERAGTRLETVIEDGFDASALAESEAQTRLALLAGLAAQGTSKRPDDPDYTSQLVAALLAVLG